MIKNNETKVIRGDDPNISVTRKAFDDGSGRKDLVKNSYVDNTTYQIVRSQVTNRNSYI